MRDDPASSVGRSPPGPAAGGTGAPGRTANVYWHEGEVSADDRQRLLGQQGCVLWFCGLSGSGKSTIARALESELHGRGRLVYVLDGDNLRHGLNAGLGFSAADRDENLRRVAEVAKLFADCGVICMTAFISPLRRNRDRAREIIGSDRFLEVYVSTALEVCEQRDVKGLYRRARTGDVPEFTGVSAPFEAPPAPLITLDTGRLTVAEAVARAMEALQRRGMLEPPSPSPGQ